MISSGKRQTLKSYPPLRALLKALNQAKSFVHLVSYGITQIMMGALKVTAQHVPVRGIVAGRNLGEQITSDVEDYKNEAPDLSIAFWNHERFRGVDEPHQKLIIIDELLAFKGSGNFTRTAWRSAA
jgi:phosphatidylserine/phosphatidylglycerophosphate/cardiolipin synthase-like enzyme